MQIFFDVIGMLRFRIKALVEKPTSLTDLILCVAGSASQSQQKYLQNVLVSYNNMWICSFEKSLISNAKQD